MMRLAALATIPALAAAETCGSVDLSGVKLISFDVYAALADLGTSLNDNINEVMDGLASTSQVSTLVNHWEGYYTAIKDVSGMAQNDVLFGEGTVEWGGDDRFQTFKNISLTKSLASSGLTDVVDDDTFVQLTDTWNNLQAWPNTVEALQMLRDYTNADGNPQFQLAIMSNGDCEGLTKAAEGWDFEFDHVFCSSNVGMFKPEYDFYQQSVSISGFDQSEILHVAGASFDVTGAKAADLHCAHNQVQQTNNGVNWMDEPQYDVDCYFPTLLDLAEGFTGQTAKSGAEQPRVSAPRAEPAPAVEGVDLNDMGTKGDIDTSSTKLVVVDLYHTMTSVQAAMDTCAEGILTPLGVDAATADAYAKQYSESYWNPLRDIAGMGRNPDIEWSTGTAFGNWIKMASADAAGSAKITDVVTADVEAELEACWGQLAARDGALDSLATIQGMGYQVGALSFANANATTSLVDSWGFDFDVVVSAEDAVGNAPAYPDAQLFDALLTKSGLERDEVLVFAGYPQAGFGSQVFGFQTVGNTQPGGSWINWTGNSKYNIPTGADGLDGLVELLQASQ